MASLTQTHADQLQISEYRNWVKAGLAPKYLKEGIQTYIDDEFKSILSSFLTDICRHLSIAEATCSSCTTANVLPCPTYGICNLRQMGGICKYHVRGDPLRESKTCPNKVCDKLFVKITNLHRFHYPSWRNTDARKWCTNHWEIAKCFLPATGYDVKPSAGETDCSGILNIAVNCLSFGNIFHVNIQPPNGIISKIIKSRNDVVHSATLNITDDQLKDYIDLMIALLEDKKALATNIDAQNAVRKLTQLKDCKFCITPKNEEDIRAEGTKAAEQKKKDDYLGRKNELQTGLCSIYEDHFKSVPISPPLDELTENVDDVFVKLVIREDLIHDPKKTQQTGQGKKVDNLIDIFCNHRNDKICKNMYVVGNAGMGKTTWCMKLLSTWVSAHIRLKGPSQGTNILTKDESMMLEFDVVLFVSLRHALFKSNIRDMVKDQLFSNRPNLDQLTSEVLEREPDKCLVIIDGLDEWNHPENPKIISPLQHPGLPNRKNLYDCPCLTTTRPWKLEELRLPTNEIDLAVTIEGLDDKKLLAEKVIEIRLKGIDDDIANERTIDNFTTFLEAVSFKQYTTVWNALNFISIPLILVFIVSLWFDEGKLESTWAGTFCRFLECLILKAEGDRRRGRKGRLQQVEGIDNLREEWERSTHLLPETIHGKHIRKYSTLLLKLGKLAFNSLITLETTETLVFSEQTLKNSFSEKELEVAVKIGILSQSKVVGKTIKPMCSLSFLHKTIQEYFAALYMCSVVKERYKNLQKFKAFCCNQLCINKMENVILFVYGLDPMTANILSQHIAYIQLTQGSVLDVNLALKCCKELEDYQRVKEPNSYIACIYGATIENSNILKLTNMHWAYIQKLTIHLNDDENNHNLISAPDQLQAVSDTLKWSQLKETDSKSKTYRCLKTAVSRTNIQEIDLSQVEHLHEVSLKNIEHCKVLLNSKALRYMSFNRTKMCTFIIQHNSTSLDHVPSSIDDTDSGMIICDNLEECTVYVHVLSLSKTTDMKLRNCNSCTIELNTNQIIVDSILTDNGSDLTTSSYTLSSNLNINTVDIDRCNSCEFKMEVVHQYQTTEFSNSNEQLKNKQKSSDKPWLVNRIKFLECESCKLSVAVSDTHVPVLDKEDYIACKSFKSNNKTIKINTVSFEKSKSCELNIYCAIHNGKVVNFDKEINAITNKSSDESIIRNLELSNSSLCELKFRNIKTRKEQKDLTLYDPSLVVDFIHINEVFFTNTGKEKQLSLLVRNGQSNSRNQIQAEMLSVSRTMHNKSGNISNAIKPIEHLKEITIGSVSEEVPLTQIFESLTGLEKLCLNSRIQSEMTFSIEPQMLPNKCIGAYMIRPISLLINLKYLDLSGLSVDAYKVAANVLPTMQLIEKLFISDSNIKIPECFIRSIQSLKHLKCLDLHGLSVDAYQHAAHVLPTMKLIEELVISNSNIPILESIVRSIESLKSLKRLTLRGSFIENFSELVSEFLNMPQTETLDISITENDLPQFYKLPYGYLIPFKNNLIWGKTKEQAEHLAKHAMTDIKKYTLSIKHADISTSAIPALKYLVNLDHLTIEISGDIELNTLEELRFSFSRINTFELLAKDTDISDCVYKYISCLNNLKHLTLKGRRISQLENLAMSFSLKYLSLKGKQIQSVQNLVSILPKLRQLETLKLSSRDTDIQGSVLYFVRNSYNLKHLTLEGRQIQGLESLIDILPSFMQLETLKLLSRDTDIPESVVKSIEMLYNLKHLTLEGREIESVEYLPYCLPLQLETFKLSTRDIDIPEFIVESIRMLYNLKHLKLEGRRIQNIESLVDILPELKQLETLKLSARDTDIVYSML